MNAKIKNNHSSVNNFLFLLWGLTGECIRFMSNNIVPAPMCKIYSCSVINFLAKRFFKRTLFLSSVSITCLPLPTFTFIVFFYDFSLDWDFSKLHYFCRLLSTIFELMILGKLIRSWMFCPSAALWVILTVCISWFSGPRLFTLLPVLTFSIFCLPATQFCL